MKNLRRSKLYRTGSALMAAVMMFTCMPQAGMYASAEESQISEVDSGTSEDSGELQQEDAGSAGGTEENSFDQKPADDNSGVEGQPENDNPEGEGQPENGNPEEGQPDGGDGSGQDSGTGSSEQGGGMTDDELDIPDDGMIPDQGTVPSADGDTETADASVTAPIADGDTTQPSITYTIGGNLNKKTYLVGESYDLTGITITSTDGKNIPVSAAQVSFDSGSAGVKSLSVTYGSETRIINVLVIDKLKVSAEYGMTLSEIVLPGADTILGTWEWADDSQKITKVGKQTYKASFKPNDSGAYTSYNGADAEVTVTCDLSSWADIELKIPSTQGYTYDKKEKKPEVTVSVNSNNLLVGKDYKVTYSNNIDAGTDSAVVTVEGQGNYKGQKTATFSIKKAKLTIRAKSKTIYCGDPNPVPPNAVNPDPNAYKFEYEISGLADGDSLGTEPTFACEIIDTKSPAKYDIIPSGAAVDSSVAGNYEAIDYMNGILTVEVFVPQPVVIGGMPSVLDTTYDKNPWTHHGKGVVRISGASGDVTGVTAKPHYTGETKAGTPYDSDTAPTAAGDYELTFELDGKNKDKYALQAGADTFTFTIKEKTVTIKAPSKNVAAGESVPEPDSLKNGVSVSGILKGDKQDAVLDLAGLSLSYSEENISAAKAGTYDIIPGGVTVNDLNYAVEFVNGVLTVEGRKGFEADFTSIKANDKTYDGLPHSISGYATDESKGTFLYTIQVTDETRKKEALKDPNGGGNAGSDALPDYVKQEKGVSVNEIVQRYQKVAPVDVGRYTLEIFAEVNTDLYEYDGDPLLEKTFYVTPLQKREMQLVGMDGITDKEYDGEPVDLSSQIKNVKLLTNQGVDVTDKVKMIFKITGTTVYSGDGYQDYSKTVDANDPSVSMPKQAGKYELHVKLEKQEPNNYLEHEWSYPFEISRKKMTVTVNGQEMHVGDEKLEAGNALPENRFKDQYQIEGILDADQTKFAEKLIVVPLQTVEGNVTGVYDLALSGLVESDWPDYEITWTGAKLIVKGQLHKIKDELSAVTNVFNGTTLEEIAKSRLPKTTTIYLYGGGRKPGKDEPAVPDIEDTAEIVWDTEKTAPGTSYNINTKTPQTFKMQGTVALPELVYADKDTSLTVTVSVSVREASEGQALKPVADVPAGKVALGTKVRLSTPEEGADIIYTVEANNPAVSVPNQLYTEPIEIRNTMTIRAVTRIAGKRDSDELRITYYLDKTLNPGGDDPNNPDGPDPDVPAEDIPKDENGKPLKIPEGLWVTDVKGYVYTGKAIKPEVRVYDHKTRLEEKKDYTISYKNNINAADKKSAKAPTITVTGKGNYEGKLTKTFTISPKNIEDTHEYNVDGKTVKVYDVQTDDLTTAYNGKAQKPVPVVTWNGKKLSAKKDYTFDAAPQTIAGNYKIKLTGTGNYTGERQITFSIIEAGTPAAKLTVGKIAAQIYTGKEIRPDIVVKSGKQTLGPGTDYTLSYEDNIEVGTASVIIKGAGRFIGVKRVTFAIKEVASLNKAKAELRFAAPVIYTGKEITASDYLVTVQVKEGGVSQTRQLVKDKDYKVTYQNNVKVGNATAVFEGIGAYRGTLKKKFKISAYDLELDPSKKLSIQAEESYPYMKGGSKQKPIVKFDGKVLKEGTDYTLSYKNHTAAGSHASMTIKGKGSFTGSVKKGYAVTVQDIGKMTVVPADKAYQPKSNIYKTTVRVQDSDGKALTAGKDYDKNFIYTYERTTTVKDTSTGADITRRKGDTVAGTDLIPALTEIRVTINAAGNNYQGTASGTYRIGRASIAKAKVTVPPQTYTGKEIRPKETEITVVLNGMVLSPNDYKIISYSNNVNKGTAKLTIQGNSENYGGMKTVSFKIRRKSLIAQIIG